MENENKLPEGMLDTPEKPLSVPSNDPGTRTPENSLDFDEEEGHPEDDNFPDDDFQKKHPEFVAGQMHKKRLERGHRYFDSGDYNMAKAKFKKVQDLTEPKKLIMEATGEDIPTPANIPHKKHLPPPGIAQ